MIAFETFDRFLDERLKMWKKKSKNNNFSTAPVITISREPGCESELIARGIADKLGLIIYNKEIVEQIAKVTHATENLVKELDEKTRSKLGDWIATTQYKPALSTFSYFQGLKKVIFSIAAHGKAIIIGRGGNFLLPPKNRFSLRFVAPFEIRLKKTMLDLKLSEKNAKHYIAQAEQEQRLFTKRYFNAEIGNPAHYHLVINTFEVKAKTIPDLVKNMMNTNW